MSATLDNLPRGGGEHPQGGHQVGAGGDPVADLEGMDARQAIESLEGDFATGKLDLLPPQFPGPIAEAFYYDDATVLGIMGPVGSGKTTTKYKSRLRRAMMMPRSVIDGRRYYKLLVVRQTYRQLWSTTIPDFLSVFPKALGDWSGGRGAPVRFLMKFDDIDINGSVPPPPGHQGDWSDEIVLEVEFMAFGDDVQAAMRGYQATDIDLHEMDTNTIDVILNGITRINRHPSKAHFVGYPANLRDYGQLVGDFNAPEPDSWVCKLFLDETSRKAMLLQMNAKLDAGAKPIEISFHRQPGFGEPGAENLHNLGPTYYQVQIATLTLLGRGDTIDRLVYNKIVHTRAGTPVFQREFQRRIHVADRPLPLWPGVPLRVGLDQGLKGAAVIAQFLSEGAGITRRFRWRILAELHYPTESLLARVFGERLAELLATPRFSGFRVQAAWGDMAGEQGVSAAADENDTWNRLVSRAAGFRVRPQRIGTNRITPRLEAVRAGLEAPIWAGEPGLLIDPSCAFLIAGFEARYVWTDEINAAGDKRKVPDKRLTEANVHDALQYLLLSEHLATGLSPMSFPGNGQASQLGHNGGPPLTGEEAGGLRTDYDLFNPHGGL